MRYNISKQHSTKAERLIYETLKRLRVPFKHRWLVKGREIDFIIRDKYVLEIDGHLKTDSKKNHMLLKEGYVPIHLRNKDIYKFRNQIEEFIKKL